MLVATTINAGPTVELEICGAIQRVLIILAEYNVGTTMSAPVIGVVIPHVVYDGNPGIC